MTRREGFTLIEVIVAMAVFAIVVVTVTVIINPNARIQSAQEQRAIEEMAEIAKAVQLYALDNGVYPPDANRDIPTTIDEYINTFNADWPEGPFPGSVYDYDNWLGDSCITPEGGQSIQISLRQVPGRNPDGSDVWAWYYPIVGPGAPHCNNSNEYDKGECVTCPGFSF